MRYCSMIFALIGGMILWTGCSSTTAETGNMMDSLVAEQAAIRDRD